MLTIKTGQQQSTILIAPNRQTHYIYTANHPGGRYEMTVTAFSPTGRGETSAPISTVSACGYDIVLPPNGIIHSLHSPYFLKKFYEPDVACQWNIRASEGQRLKVHFDAINLADNTLACMEDYVMINEDRFCRNVSTGGYYITNKTDAKIIFKSSLGITVKPGGFNISIEAIDVMPTVTQVVNSPGLIRLNWVPPESMKNTSYKYALKYRVLPELNQKVLRLGPSIHQFVIPTGGDIGRQYELELSIITKEEEGRPIKYTVRSACGHNVTVDHTGIIHNPSSFGLYQPDVLCEWYITAFQGQYFQLRISTLELESSQNCENDFLAINSQKYCNTSDIPVSALIFNDTVRVSFHSNGSVQRRGFSLRYEMVCTAIFFLKIISFE
ncbi:cubilin-like isoform X2 [Ostrea edulis]|uniref:cubilin-like isoform X2 n=1 Tax=Ostrea edulis TaxID=37623 RepID=UPI002095B5B2|nr:cubilin-like isoform X2 [Ostrea edulis]